MNDHQKTKVELLQELADLREEMARLKALHQLKKQVTQIELEDQASQESDHLPQDITEQAWREETFRVLFEHSIDAHLIFNETGIVDCNNAAVQMLRCKNKQEILSRHPAELSPEYQPDGRRSLEKAIEMDATAQKYGYHRFEWIHRRLDGEDFPVEVTINPVMLHGKPAMLVVWHDITERKRAEEALAKRATELETVAQVSVAASTILETTKLLQEVVELTKTSFGLYHAHIYLLNKAGDTLNLAAGAGEIGQQMVAQEWSISLAREQSLVARAARTRQGVIENNVRTAPDWLPNPLLPETRSELAVPMIVGERVLGVLDVQADEIGHFSEEDVRIQTTLAAQVAVALQNALSFAEQQQTGFLLSKRVRELNCLNEIGRAITEAPPIGALLQWVTERIPAAMQYPELCRVAIEYKGQLYGAAEAIKLATHMTNALRIGQEALGRMYVAYRERRDFLDEESAMLGGIASRVSAYIESQRLVEQIQQRAIELEDAQTFLDSIIENMPSALFVKEAKELRFVRWNKASETLFGFSKEGIVGKNDYDLFPKEEADFFTTKDREVLAGGQLVDIPEEPIHTAQQGLRFLHTTKVPIFGADGQPKYLLGLSEDITERKATEESLRASEERFALATMGTQDGIWDWDIKNSTLYWSPRLKEMLGYKPDEIEINFDTFASFLHPEDAETTGAALEAHLKQRVPYDIEQRLRAKSGEYIWFRVRGQAIWDEAGNPIRISGSSRDITMEKAVAAEREQLLAEVEAAYRQYVQREWEQFLSGQHQGSWRIEHQQNVESSISDEELAKAQAEVAREGKAKVVAGHNGQPTQPTIVAPITLRGQVIGTLSLQDIDPNRHWTDEEKALLETVSEQLALTVENLRLFDDTQKRATREQLTRQITDRMRAAPDINSIIQTGLAELAKALRVSRTYVKLMTRPEVEHSRQASNGHDHES